MTQDAELDEALKMLATKSNGMMRCALVDPDNDLLPLMADADAGDEMALPASRILAGVAAFAKDLGQPSDKPRLCLLCPTPLTVANTNRYVVLICDDGTAPRVVMGLCPDCSARPNVIDDVVLKLREVWSDLRKLDIHPDAGHA